MSMTQEKMYMNVDDVCAVLGVSKAFAYEHIQYVFFSLSKNTSKVKNIRQYMLTVLYNAPVTINQFYDAEVRHDMYGG